MNSTTKDALQGSILLVTVISALMFFSYKTISTLFLLWGWLPFSPWGFFIYAPFFLWTGLLEIAFQNIQPYFKSKEKFTMFNRCSPLFNEIYDILLIQDKSPEMPEIEFSNGAIIIEKDDKKIYIDYNYKEDMLSILFKDENGNWIEKAKQKLNGKEIKKLKQFVALKQKKEEIDPLVEIKQIKEKILLEQIERCTKKLNENQNLLLNNNISRPIKSSQIACNG